MGSKREKEKQSFSSSAALPNRDIVGRFVPKTRGYAIFIAAALDYNKKIRKTPIVVKDVRGFFTNQVFPPYVNEASLMVIEGVSMALIENCADLLGLPIGPLAVSDDTTLKLGHDIMTSTQEEMGDKYVPTGTEEFMANMVTKWDRAGRRFGAGFYNYDENGKPIIVGVRRNGERVDVSAMSDGTLDPLFLSLRLAYLQDKNSEFEPMPLIVDDILIHLDDDRALATLEVLAEYSKQTQVLFFTHHHRLRELAEQHLSSDTLTVHELEKKGTEVSPPQPR